MRLAVLALLLVACGDNKKAPSDAGPDGPLLNCGDGNVDSNEDCDDGPDNGGPTARCDIQCHWVCLDNAWCTDNEPCNGEETCVDHACVAGTDVADGTTCGTDQLCRNGDCTDAVCGDLFVTSPEECDDGNATAGDGCDNSCRYSCVSTDTTRDCTPADACAGQGTCNDTSHTCTPGTPLSDNVACGTGGYCKTGVCTQPVCGNGMIEPGEICDNGAANSTVGDGCKTDCTYECVVPASDCPAAPACQMRACNGSHACAPVADTSMNGATCGSGLVCSNGACVTPSAVCGNGTTETGEQCDFGSGNNGPGTGCELNCQFSCTTTPTDSCTDGNACNGTESCGAVTVNSRPGQKCSTTGPLGNGVSCGAGMICLTQVCVTSACGDGFVNGLAGETCEPPNSSTCDSSCHTIACGDGVRAGSEQCDDSNLLNLDGCDSACKFEQCHRVNTLSMAFATNTYCTKNALGGAIVGGTAQNTIGAALTSGVNDGSISVMFKALGLDDLTGTADPSLSLGALTGAPVAGAGYNGASDLDWWYTVAASVIDAMRNPTTTVPATIVAKALSAGPADISISVSLAGVAATLDMLAAKLRGNIGATSTPLTSAGGTPGHLASEHLDPTLVSYATMTGGELCGNVTAQSLDNVPAPSALVGCGFTNCTKCYTAANSLLDILVGGCTVFILQQIRPTQPDGARTSGDTYAFTVTGTSVTGCTKNGQPGVLSDCLANATYSSFLRFTTDRVIGK